MTSVFYTQESAFMDEPVLFIYRKEGGRQSEQSKKSEIRIHVTGRIEGKYGKEQTGIGSCDPQQKPSGAEKETGGTQRTFPPADCQRGRV